MSFHKSEGGRAEINAKNDSCTYIFPQNATVRFAGVDIPVGNIRGESHYGSYDEVSIEALANAFGQIPSANPQVTNTTIFLSERKCSSGYPDKEEFAETLHFLGEEESEKITNSVYLEISEANKFLARTDLNSVQQKQGDFIMAVRNTWLQVNRSRFFQQVRLALEKKNSPSHYRS